MPFLLIHALTECRIFRDVFSQVSNAGVNTALKPEQSDTYQLGFNTYKKVSSLKTMC